MQTPPMPLPSLAAHRGQIASRHGLVPGMDGYTRSRLHSLSWRARMGVSDFLWMSLTGSRLLRQTLRQHVADREAQVTEPHRFQHEGIHPHGPDALRRHGVAETR